MSFYIFRRHEWEQTEITGLFHQLFFSIKNSFIDFFTTSLIIFITFDPT
jgi:uncharacterized protein (DUF952 family)